MQDIDTFIHYNTRIECIVTIHCIITSFLYQVVQSRRPIQFKFLEYVMAEGVGARSTTIPLYLMSPIGIRPERVEGLSWEFSFVVAPHNRT